MNGWWMDDDCVSYGTSNSNSVWRFWSTEVTHEDISREGGGQPNCTLSMAIWGVEIHRRRRSLFVRFSGQRRGSLEGGSAKKQQKDGVFRIGKSSTMDMYSGLNLIFMKNENAAWSEGIRKQQMKIGQPPDTQAWLASGMFNLLPDGCIMLYDIGHICNIPYIPGAGHDFGGRSPKLHILQVGSRNRAKSGPPGKTSTSRWVSNVTCCIPRT